MRRNPFLRFHQAAESAAYPAMLVVSVVCLAIVVAPVALVGITQAVWALALALLSLLAAIGMLTGELVAAFSDADDSAAGREVAPRALPQALPARKAVVPLEPHDAPRPERRPGRKAA